MKKEEWIAKRKHEIFPFQYFHVVFTLPHQLNPLIMRNKKKLYDLLFETVKQTLLSVSEQKKYFGARIGFFSILHTWGQKLTFHPHLHCVVPGGGYQEPGKQWIRSPKDFLLPVPVLRKRFRSLYLTKLKTLYKNNELAVKGTGLETWPYFQKMIDQLFSAQWVVYVKESFRSSDSVIEYLSRYTHKIAISNYRIISFENEIVKFSYKDYSDGNKLKQMTLPVLEFMRRFFMHVVPRRFVRIRYYGLMANRNKKENIALCCRYYGLEEQEKEKEQSWDERMFEVSGIDVHTCPQCGEGKLCFLGIVPEQRYRPPPEKALE